MKLPFGREAIPADRVAAPPPQPEPTRAPSPVKALQPDFRVRLAEEVWRLGRRVDRAASSAGAEALHGVRDSVRRLDGILSENGIEVRDEAGQRYQEGLRLTVLHVEGDGPDDLPLWITETVQPTILVDGRVHSQGQVILTRRPAEAYQP